MSHFVDWTSSLDMVTWSKTRKLLFGVHIVRVWGRKGGRWNIRVTDMAPKVTKSKLEFNKRIQFDHVGERKRRSNVFCVCMQFAVVPPVLPTDRIPKLGMLWKGYVNSYQRRAVLQHHVAANQRYPTRKTKTRSKGNKRKREAEKQTEAAVTGLQWWRA